MGDGLASSLVRGRASAPAIVGMHTIEGILAGSTASVRCLVGPTGRAGVAPNVDSTAPGVIGRERGVVSVASRARGVLAIVAAGVGPASVRISDTIDGLARAAAARSGLAVARRRARAVRRDGDVVLHSYDGAV